jgi:tetratricopeptide (TPR) repeat protein
MSTHKQTQQDKHDKNESGSQSNNHSKGSKETRTRKRDIALSGAFWVGVAGLFLYGIFNAIASQLVHPLYFSFINEDRDTVITFLEKTRRTDVYPRIETQLSQSIQVLEEDVLMNDTKRNQTIAELEAVLEQNEKSRDVLVALAALYNEAGNEEKYKEYLNRAREVDPEIAD